MGIYFCHVCRDEIVKLIISNCLFKSLIIYLLKKKYQIKLNNSIYLFLLIEII